MTEPLTRLIRSCSQRKGAWVGARLRKFRQSAPVPRAAVAKVYQLAPMVRRHSLCNPRRPIYRELQGVRKPREE